MLPPPLLAMEDARPERDLSFSERSLSLIDGVLKPGLDKRGERKQVNTETTRLSERAQCCVSLRFSCRAVSVFFALTMTMAAHLHLRR